jgi:hypothetical protein
MARIEYVYAGMRILRRARSTGTLVGLYHAAEAGIDNDPENPWVTVCEEHNTFVSHQTRKHAEGFLSHPYEWCELCRQAFCG